MPIVLAAALALALAATGSFVGETRAGRADDSVARAQTPEPAPPRDAGVDASWRFGENGEIVAPPGDEDYRCLQPAVEIPKAEPCADGRGYPACRWQLPIPTDDTYEIWRNTTPEHRWGRPGLVSLILASAAEYARRWPGEHIQVGDLDAAGPRHQTHDRGVDVNLYLTEAMMTRNEGHHRYVDNYEQRGTREVRLLRARVMDFARILATCARGRIRIYYNDPEIVRPFRQWFEEHGFHSDVGHPMQRHNRLHEFHFHLTTPEDLPPLPTAD